VAGSKHTGSRRRATKSAVPTEARETTDPTFADIDSVDVDLSTVAELADWLERRLLVLMSRVKLSPELIEQHGIYLARLYCYEDGTLEDVDGTGRKQALEHILILHEAAHPWPHATINMLVMSYLNLRVARTRRGSDLLKALIKVSWAIGFSTAELDLVPPRVNALVNQHMEWSASDHAADLETEQGLRAMMSAEMGRRGAQRRHENTRALKEWALRVAKDMKGSDKQVADELVRLMPLELKRASKDPGTFIYKALLTDKHKR
jgi:hypothetical protein